MNFDALKEYLLARASEPSTWRGLVLAATAAGTVLSEDQKEAIVTLGLFFAGAIGALFPDRR